MGVLGTLRYAKRKLEAPRTQRSFAVAKGLVETKSAQREDDEDVDDWCPYWRYEQEKLSAGYCKTVEEAKAMFERDCNDVINFKTRKGRVVAMTLPIRAAAGGVFLS